MRINLLPIHAAFNELSNIQLKEWIENQKQNVVVKNYRFEDLKTLPSDHVFSKITGKMIFGGKNKKLLVTQKVAWAEEWLKRRDDKEPAAMRYLNLPIHLAFNKLSNCQLKEWIENQKQQLKKEDKKSSPLPEHDKQQQADRRKSGESLQVAGAGQQRSPGGDQDQGQQRLGAKKSREQQSSELKEFQDNFQLAGSKSPTSTTPRVSVKQGSQGGTPLPSPQPPGQDTSGAPPPDLAPATPSAGDQGSPAPSTGSLSDSVKKSTLNPNAKEFSLNPTAKEFTPRAPTSSRVNPTPPRPQTPNTPNSMTAMAAGIPQVGVQQSVTSSEIVTTVCRLSVRRGPTSCTTPSWG